MESFSVLMSSCEDEDEDDDEDEEDDDDIEIRLRMKMKKMMNITSCQPKWILHLIVL